MKYVKIGMVLPVCLYLIGCASSAKMENMIYQGTVREFDENLKNGVEVSTVQGGQDTNPMWTSEISGEAFGGAVKETLLKQGLLSENGKYELEVKLISVEKPFMGLDMTVTTFVQYILTDKSNGNLLLDEVIIAPFTATMGDSLIGVKRLRLANEGSGRTNIEFLLNKLSELKIKPSEISAVNF